MNLLRRSAEPFLPDRDYLPIAMPTTDVQVLQVLTRHGAVLRRYSDMASVLQVPGGTDEPAVYRDQAVVDADGTWSRAARLGVGLSVVSAILKALGAEAAVEFSCSGAASVQYRYADVVADRVDLASLDAWLDQADFRPGLRNIADLLAAEDVYVIVAVLKAGALSVSLRDEDDAGVTVAIPAIQAAVGGKVSVSMGGTRGQHLVFRGQTALTVAAKAAQLKFDESGFWVNERLVTRAEVRGIPGADGTGVSYLRASELRLG
jgi:hypothetical protein